MSVRNGSVVERIKTALDAVDYLPNAVSAWTEAHGGNRSLADTNEKKLRQAEELLGQILASLPNSREYRVVGVEGILAGSTFKTEAGLVAALSAVGFKRTGTQSNGRLRPELVGAPQFTGLVGPMYDGPGVCRYETAEVYDANSR